jgi:hypothetical protein
VHKWREGDFLLENKCISWQLIDITTKKLHVKSYWNFSEKKALKGTATLKRAKYNFLGHM